MLPKRYDGVTKNSMNGEWAREQRKEEKKWFDKFRQWALLRGDFWAKYMKFWYIVKMYAVCSIICDCGSRMHALHWPSNRIRIEMSKQVKSSKGRTHNKAYGQNNGNMQETPSHKENQTVNVHNTKNKNVLLLMLLVHGAFGNRMKT